MPTETALLFAGLLFLAAALGYLFARYGESEEEPDTLNPDYIRGLNFVLDEQPDRALEVFLRLAEVDDDMLETHFTLGNLFRRQGELDRAIKVHENLISRPALTQAQQERARFAVAEDYMAAGLYDRAEDIFRDLRSSSEWGRQAVERLLRICEITRDWTEAVVYLEELSAQTSVPDHRDRSIHYYCELADAARIAGDLDGARDHLAEICSLQGAGGSVRADLSLADLELASEAPSKAASLYAKVIAEDPTLTSEVLARFHGACTAAGDDQRFDGTLKTWRETDEGFGLQLASAAALDSSLQGTAVMRDLANFVQHDAALSALVGLDARDLPGDDSNLSSMVPVQEGINGLVRRVPRYRCGDCGYTGQRFVWQCQNCQSWDSVRPLDIHSLLNRGS